MRIFATRLAVTFALVLSACGPGTVTSEAEQGRPAQLPSVGPSGEPTPDPSPDASPEPQPARPYRFAVLGDWGTGLRASDEVARAMCRWRRRHGFRMVVTTGDNVYPDGARENFRRVFYRPFGCLLQSGVSFRSTLGNHDVVTRSGLPELKEERFGFRGRNYVMRKRSVRFVMADSNSLNREWLRHALRAQPGDRWTIVVFHHPVFSSGEHGSTPGFGDLPKMFARKGVDLVLHGHDHLYTVSRPVRKIRYVVTGGGGASPYRCTRRWFTARCIERYHFLYVTAKPDELVVRAVGTGAKRFHRFATKGRP